MGRSGGSDVWCFGRCEVVGSFESGTYPPSGGSGTRRGHRRDGRPPRGSEQDLAEELRIGRPTMRAAPKQFVDEGLLTYRRGIGTVISTKPVRRAVALTSLYDDLMESGREPITSVSNTEVTLCPPEVTEPLGSGQMLPYCASTGCAWRASSRAPSCTTSSRLACWR